MNLLIGSAMAFISNLFNILEVQELSESRENYKSYQALLVSTTFGLILALFIGATSGMRFNPSWIVLFHALIWLAQILASFTLTKKLHPVTYRIAHSLQLPMIIIIDTIFGNINLNTLTVIGFIFIVSSVFVKIRKEGSIVIEGMSDGKIFSLVGVWIFGSAFVKVLKYQIRTNYDISTIDFMITNAAIAIPIYLAFLIAIKEFKPRSITDNKQSHFKAGSYSAIQQFLGVYMSGYITATMVAVLRNVTAYLAVPISKKSKDIKIRQVAKDSHIYFIVNIIGTIMIIGFS